MDTRPDEPADVKVPPTRRELSTATGVPSLWQNVQVIPQPSITFTLSVRSRWTTRRAPISSGLDSPWNAPRASRSAVAYGASGLVSMSLSGTAIVLCGESGVGRGNGRGVQVTHADPGEECFGYGSAAIRSPSARSSQSPSPYAARTAAAHCLLRALLDEHQPAPHGPGTPPLVRRPGAAPRGSVVRAGVIPQTLSIPGRP